MTRSKQGQSHAISLVERLPLFFSAIVTLATLAWVLWYCRYGIDFTDEGYYLAWISNPFSYAISATQFGFIYHPLYELLDGNIAIFRQVNVLITFCLSWVLVNVFLKTVFFAQSLEHTPRLIISAAFSTTAAATLLLAGMWLSTPGYNSLAIQALLLATTGLLLADKNVDRKSIVGWLLIGVGGWLTFMAKPTTAAALALCASFYLLLAGKFSLRLLTISIAVAVGLIVLSAFMIDGSIIAFIARLREGAEIYGILGGGIHDRVLRMDDLELGKKGWGILVASTAVFFSAAYFSQAKSKALVQGSTLLAIAFALASGAIIFGLPNQISDLGPFQGILICSVAFAAILAGFVINRFKGLFRISRPHWALMLTFFMLPYAYAFGTGNNYWFLAVNAGIFWILAGLVFLSPAAHNQKFHALLLPLGLAVQLIIVALVQTGINAPYRQPQPLRYNDYNLEIGRPGSNLMLPTGVGQYFAGAIVVAKQGGFKTGSPMIDLSGRSLGILHGLGAVNLGLGWGGYPGSDQLVKVYLQKVSCEYLATAWLLVEPEGPAKISPQVLESFGANIDSDYQSVGMFQTAEGAGGYKEVRVQQLLKPVRSVASAIDACSAARKAK